MGLEILVDHERAKEWESLELYCVFVFPLTRNRGNEMKTKDEV